LRATPIVPYIRFSGIVVNDQLRAVSSATATQQRGIIAGCRPGERGDSHLQDFWLLFRQSTAIGLLSRTVMNQLNEMALRVKDPEARHRFVELARKWRALAKENNEQDHT
jgi:hypothetical protein